MVEVEVWWYVVEQMCNLCCGLQEIICWLVDDVIEVVELILVCFIVLKDVDLVVIVECKSNDY